MGSKQQAQKNSTLAKTMKEAGIYHGKRQGPPGVSNIPNLKDVGSAAYRRLRKR
jgi:hypothetical protein